MLALLLYAVHAAPTLRIETDLFALLPTQEVEPEAAAAQSQYADVLSRKLLFLVGAGNADQARAIAARFTASLRAAKVFESVMLEADAAALDSKLYRAHRFGLLADAQREALRGQRSAQLRDQALREVYSPGMAPHALSTAEDPFNFLGHFLAQQASGIAALGAVQLDHGLLMLADGDRKYVLIAAQIAQEPFSGETQDRVIPVIAAAAAEARKAGAEVIASGLILHAAEAARSARKEINRVGSLSMIGVALMILLTFRSLRPLLLSVLILGSGAIAALSLCQLVFGKVTLIALVFGSGLIGVAVDYSTHFLADQFRNPVSWTPREALDHVGPGIAMGMGCAVLGYLSLGLTPLPGLRQMAVFSAAGLVVACVGVLCWYPLLAPAARRGEPLPLRWALKLDEVLGRGGGRSRTIVTVALIVLGLLGLARVRFSDDIHLLNTPAPALLADEIRVHDLLRATPDSQFFLVKGSSSDEVLQREEVLRAALDAQVSAHALDGFRAISRALPSARRQAENRSLLAVQVYGGGGVGPPLMDALGFPPELIAQRLAEFAAAEGPLKIESWLADDASLPYRDLWLGSLEKGYASIVSLSGIHDFAALRELPAQMQGVQFVDRVASLSELLGRYRRLALKLLAAAYGLIGVAMALRYGPKDAAGLLSAPLSAALLTLALLGALDGPLNLFHVLGLFVVLGLGVDYAVFLREGEASRTATVLAISLSTLGAVLSYGLLAFSATPFIRAIGLTLLIGVGCTWLLALLIQRPAVTALVPLEPSQTP